jgi:hypothetical protein
MRKQVIAVGSIADHLTAVVLMIRDCPDLCWLEYRWPRIAHALEVVVGRGTTTRCRGGSATNLAGPLACLDRVLRTHPALQEPGGVPLRDELARLVGRIRRAAGL